MFVTFPHSQFKVCVGLRHVRKTISPQSPTYIIHWPTDFFLPKIKVKEKKMLAPEYSLRFISDLSNLTPREVKELVFCRIRFCLKNEDGNDSTYLRWGDCMSAPVEGGLHNA